MPVVVLDTSTLHNEGLFSPSMQRLARLSRELRLRLLIPSLVRREYVSKLGLDARDAFHKAARELRRTTQRLNMNSDLTREIDALVAQSERLSSRMEGAFAETFQRWAARNRVEELQLPEGAANAVLDSYFAGTSAFRQPKSRDDFPDAFIYVSIEHLARDIPGEMLHAVSADNGLRTALSSFRLSGRTRH